MEADNRMVLRTEDLVKKYGKRTVVSHVSIDVKQGEIVGLLGPNGAGKTTSFYMTVGLITPNEGRIFLNDLDITKYPVYKRAQAGIGYLAQEASVFRQMSVEDNIMSVLEMTGKPLDYRKEKLESLLTEFRIQKVRKNKGNQLSGGERRRTEIARCLAIDPKFIMLDEPFAGVDPIAVEDIQQIVWKLKDKNIGILITDHNVQETLSITDRAYLLFEGKILFRPQRAGDAQHHRPRLPLVRGENPLPGHARGAGGEPGGAREVPEQQLRPAAQGFHGVRKVPRRHRFDRTLASSRREFTLECERLGHGNLALLKK